MPLFMILALVVALFSGIFAVQNTSPVTVNFLGYTMESSLAIVMLLTFSAGCIVSLCVSIPTMYMRQRRKQKQVTPSPSVPEAIADSEEGPKDPETL
jgi:uncharacterized integral membrane protein